ncbi:hypothetical protein ZQ79_25415 [Salmonella enterica subsp. enterica serovar Enteritidis]|nr:hypothetical protein [Salmonella enterica subsp. enterica serovar Enteritidis]
MDAIIESHQISDTLSQMSPLSNDNALIGNGYIRQILQVKVDDDIEESPSTPQPPLTALSMMSI